MGNTCCETTPHVTLIDRLDSFTQFIDYQKADLPQNDPILEQHLNDPEHEQLKENVMKHKYQNKYFLGNWNKGLPNGRGIYYDPENIFYDGQFRQGAFEGEAKVKLLKRNCQYSGQIYNGKAKGRGTLINEQQKYRFEGDWLDSKPSVGTLTFDGEKDIHKIEINEPEKTNVIFYKDNKIYQGHLNYDNYLPEGQGKLKYPKQSSKDFYEGSWKNGQMHGRGKHVWKDTSSYEGYYVEGKKQGWGDFKFASGNIYEGQWKNGKQEGIGLLSDFVGKQLKRGKWSNGKFLVAMSQTEYQKQKFMIASRIAETEAKIEEEKREEEKKEELQAENKEQNQNPASQVNIHVEPVQMPKHQDKKESEKEDDKKEDDKKEDDKKEDDKKEDDKKEDDKKEDDKKEDDKKDDDKKSDKKDQEKKDDDKKSENDKKEEKNEDKPNDQNPQSSNKLEENKQ